MKTITLKNLGITNFKGIKSLEVPFSGDVLTITGDNGTGKSSLYDAFTWCLFGKDSADRKDFNIKNTVDVSLNRADHEVELSIDVDGQLSVFKRIYREKWTKRRGSELTELTGHETNFFINDVPYSDKEYQAAVDELLLNGRFKLITNPFYFNSMKWAERRVLLTELAGGEVRDDEVAALSEEFTGLYDMMLKERKGVDLLKREYAAKKKKLTSELEAIPVRIDEIKRNMPEVVPEKEFNTELGNAKSAMQKIDRQIADKAEAANEILDAWNKKSDQIREKSNELERLVSKLRHDNDMRNMQRHGDIAIQRQLLQNAMQENDRLQKGIDRYNGEIAGMRTELEKLRGQWHDINAEEFRIDPSTLNCPTCKRPVDNADYLATTMRHNFNQDKLKRLDENEKKGKEVSERIRQIEKGIQVDREHIEENKATILVCNKKIGDMNVSDVQDDFQGHPDVIRLNKEIAAMQKALGLRPVVAEAADLQQKKAELQEQIDKFTAILTRNEMALKQEMRIKDLLEQEKEYAAQIADLERTEFLIDKFIKTKISRVEEKVNALFDGGVTFRMFKEQINGGEEPTCETLVSGVPFTDANHAGQINAGIAIINTFSQHFGIQAPIWIDNAEAVNSLHPTPSQVIRLVVSTDKSLTIN